MKKILVVIALGAILLVGFGRAEAAPLTFYFDPQGLLDNHTAGPPADATAGTSGEVVGGPDTAPGNPRSVTGGNYGAYTGVTNWNNAGPGSALDVAIGNDYTRWLANGGEPVQSNTWLDDGTAALGWDEHALASALGTGTASGGWMAQQATDGWYDSQWSTAGIQWTIDSNTDGYLDINDNGIVAGGTSPGLFSFTVDISNPATAMNPDGSYTFWFGGFAVDNNNTLLGTTSDIRYSAWNPNGHSGYTDLYFQGTMNLQPNAVPEPATLILLASGLLGFGAFRRMRGEA